LFADGSGAAVVAFFVGGGESVTVFAAAGCGCAGFAVTAVGS
jgi:hypothetical protein